MSFSLANLAVNGLKNAISSIPSMITSAANKKIDELEDRAINSINKRINKIFGLGGSSNSKDFFSNSSSNSVVGSLNKGDGKGESYEDFLGHFQTGITRANRFRVEFNLPKGVNPKNGAYAINPDVTTSSMKSINNSLNGKGSINIKCHTATFPQRALSTFEVKSNSVNFRVPYSTTYDPITLTFYADGNMDTRKFFEVWQSCALNFGNNTANFYDEYVSDVKLYIQDERNNDIYGIMLYEAFPTSIGMFDVSYSAENQLISIMISLSYKTWLPIISGRSLDYNRTF